MKTLVYLALALFAVDLISSRAQQAMIEGTVALPGKPEENAPVSRYQIKTPGTVAPPEPRVAVAYLEGNFPPPAAPLPIIKLGQRGFQFQPRVLPIQKGSVVEFPNYDDDYHNVFSYSKAKRFDLGRYRKDEKPATQTFDQPGVVKLYCEIHEHMRATILVLDTPHFAKSDAEGRFTLTNLPSGHFTLKVWFDEKTTLSRPVELKDGQTLRVDFPAR